MGNKICFLFALALVTAVRAQTAPPIKDFHQVSDRLYRGARPDQRGLQALAKMGVQTIVDLEDNAQVVASETRAAAALGMRVLSVPLNVFVRPTDAQINEILQEISDPQNGPTFVHCQFGHDRTGLVVGLYRVEYEKMAQALAYQEMVDLGFHPIYTLYVEYFEERTHWSTPATTETSVAQQH